MKRNPGVFNLFQKSNLSVIFCFLYIAVASTMFGQEKVILDTDPSYDPDDAGCMAMLHSLASLGECEILAMLNSTNHKESSLAMSAINSFYNRKAIPVGDYKGYEEKIDAPENTYDKALADNYPRNLDTWSDAIDGVKLYREILSSAEAKSITIVIIGTMHNFYGLLNSESDIYSDLNGKQLVAQKVKQVVTMGGNFIEGKGLDRTNWGGSEVLCAYTEWSCLKEERNKMTRFVIENCQAPFIASGWEVGCGDYYNANYGNVMTGQRLKELPENHIIRKSYDVHFFYRGGNESIDRHSNDQCALLYAIRGEEENFNAFIDGKITLTKKGECLWNRVAGLNHGYIQKKRDKNLIADEIESLMMGAVLEQDTTPPSAPKNIIIKIEDGISTVSWDPSVDDTKGSWVIGYDIFVDGKLQTRVYGNKYISKESINEVKVVAVNSSGISSN